MHYNKTCLINAPNCFLLQDDCLLFIRLKGRSPHNYSVSQVWLQWGYYKYLRHEVELDHGIGQRFGVGPQTRNKTQHGSVEGAVDLSER